MPFLQGEVYRYLPTETLDPTQEGEYWHRVLIVSSEEYNGGNHVLTIIFTTNHQVRNPGIAKGSVL